MFQTDRPLQINEIDDFLKTQNIFVNSIELYQKNDHMIKYLLDNKYMLKISESTLDEQMKQQRVGTLRLAPKIRSSGSFAISDTKYNYVIIDYVQGDELWSVIQNFTDEEKYNIGKEIAQFLDELHSITDVYYDIGHYIPTILRYKKSWKDGHLEYVSILRNGLSAMDLEINSQKTVSKAFDYIYANIEALEYQAGARLLHNDFHPKNIIIHERKLAGVIDWECSQFGEADFELTHLFHWCVYPPVPENKFEILLKSVIENLRIVNIPDIEKRLTIYQLEHDLNQLIWRGRGQEEERIEKINGWLNGNIGCLLK